MDSSRQENAILVAIQHLGKKVDGRFDVIDDRFGLVDERLSIMNGELAGMKATAATREHVSQCVMDLRGELSSLVRKGDGKLTSLVDMLHGRRVISDSDRLQLLSMGPYPKS